MELSYQEVYTMNKAEARSQLVQTYLKTGSIARTALLWQTSRQVVRTWVRRFQAEGKASRKVCYPAHWAWQTHQPFALAQVDVKDIRDEATLSPRLVHHLHQAHLPRYQWTFLEGRTRLRFLAFSHQNNSTNALCFAGLVLFWLRAHGITRRLQWQTDWGAERVCNRSRDSTGSSLSP
jgi:transposase-like protein